ncbi:MAG: DUF1292 domain-containing protein [Eubacteriales bacterium]
MAQEYGDDLITITDEDGMEYELEILCSMEYNNETYLALVPSNSADDEEIEVSILKVVNENDEDMLVAVENQEELEAVYSAIMDKLYEEDEA